MTDEAQAQKEVFDAMVKRRARRDAALKRRAPNGAGEAHIEVGNQAAGVQRLQDMLVAMQHNPPYWQPPEERQTPNLWLAGELDAVVSVSGLQKSAEHYGGDFVVIPDAGHNLMMEHNALTTAQTIHAWLVSQEIE